MVKKVVALLLSLVLVFAAAACSGSAPETSGSGSSTSESKSESESESSEPESGLEEDGPLKSGQYTLPVGMNISFQDSVRNDTTGKWRISVTSDSLVPADYAMQYYQTMFSSDDEIHAVWNATLKTTTRFSVMSGLLFVDTMEYVKGEEHDANILFSGNLLDSRIIDLKTGEPMETESNS